MKVLVDSSVWIQHFKLGNQELTYYLESSTVFTHPFIIQELYLGRPKGHDEVFKRLHALPSLQVELDKDILHSIDELKLKGRGIGIVDVHLLVSALKNNCKLFTLDKKLNKTFQELIK